MDRFYQLLSYLVFIMPLLSRTFGSEVYVSCATSIVRYEDEHFTQAIEQGLGRVVSLAVDSDAWILFWSDVSSSKRGIYRAKIEDFSKVERIISDVGVVNGIGLDPVRGHIYWTDESRGTVEVARYDGTDRVVLLADQLSLPRGVAVHATDGYLFWGNQGTGHIRRSRLDGSERVTLLNDTVWPNAVVWDSQRGSLLWVDGWTNKVMESTGDENAQVIVSDLSVMTNESSLFGLSVHTGQYVATFRDGRILFLSTDGQTSRVIDVRDDVQNCTELFAIVTRDDKRDLKEPGACSPNIPNPCTNMCLPTDQTEYQCACPTYGGYSLADQSSCKTPSEILLYTSTENGEIGFIDVSHPTQIQRTLIGRSRQPMGLAYDPVEQAIFYSDIKENRIYRVLFNGTGAETFLSAEEGVGIVEDIAVDYVQRHLYFTNYGMVRCNRSVFSWHKVEMISLRDRSRYVLTNRATNPHAMTLDPPQGLVYFADRDNGSDFLWQMNMAGLEQKKIILDIKGDIRINSVSISSSSGKSTLYFVASDPSSDQSWNVYQISPLDVDSNPKTRRLEISLTAASDVSSTGFSLFLTDQMKNSVVSYDIESGNITVLHHRLSTSKIIYTRQRASWTETDVCSTEGTSCSGSCVWTAGDTPNSYSRTCLCATEGLGMLNTETQSCDEPPISVVFADVGSIKSIRHGESSQFAVPHTLNTLYQRTAQGSNIVGLAYDPDTDLLYFSDGNSGSIYVKNTRANKQWLFLDSREGLQESRRKPQVIDCLTLDKLTNPKRLLWTSYEEGIICAMDTSGNNATYRELIKGLRHPRALIVDEHAKMLYWSECGIDAKVRGATIDGENIITILEHGLTWPNSILLHPETQEMYIADGKDGNIYICDRNETAWSCGMLKISGRMTHIFSMLLLDQHLYLTSWETSSVDRLNLSTGVREIVVQGLTRPTQMVAIPRRKRSSACDNNRSDCGFSEKLGGKDSSINNYLLFGLPGACLAIVSVVLTIVFWKKRGCRWQREVDEGRRQSDHTSLVTHEQSPEPSVPLDKCVTDFEEHQL